MQEHEVYLEPTRGQVREVLIYGIALGVLFGGSVALGMPAGLMLTLLVALSFLLALLLEAKRAGRVRRRTAAALAQPGEDGLEARLGRALGGYVTGLTRIAGVLRRRHVLGDVALALARDGSPRVVRITTIGNELPALEAGFEPRFEPIRLNEHDPDFQALTGSNPTVATRAREAWRQSIRAFGTSNSATALAVFGLICAALGFVQFIWMGVSELIRGQLPSAFGQVVFILPVLAVLLGYRTWIQQRILLVPGGLLVQRAPWYCGKWELELFRAREGVLLYWVEMNMVAAADASGRVVTAPLPPRIVDALLRAWRSPHEPLELERYDDFR